jgi:undecaprenyl diphosphate synthase
MDGNGRWAESRGYPRLEGHRRGVAAVRAAVESAPELGIGNLTLYAFSSDNWKRPHEEVEGLMRLLAKYLEAETGRCRENGVRVSVIGRRDRLHSELRRLISDAEAATRDCERLHLRLAIDYSSRDAMLGAARFCASWYDWTCDSLSAALPAPDVDLLIRTGGEQRLSDFLLWECAYAELLFLPCMWPDFTRRDLEEAVHGFHRRQRRFGALRQENRANLEEECAF